MGKPKARWYSPFNIIVTVVFALLALLCIYPFYYLIINSISANDLSAAGAVVVVPLYIHFDNYTAIFKLPGLFMAANISVLRTVIGSACTLAGSSFLGFLFTKQRFWHRKFWYRFVIATMYFNAGLIPTYVNMNMLHMMNNFLVYILPLVVAPFNIILVKTFIENTPISLQEAAEIDGAGPMKVFALVILPIIKPILATILVLASVDQWNRFYDTLMYVKSQDLFTLQYTLWKYMNQAVFLSNLIKSTENADVIANAALAQNPMSIQMTVSVVVTLPILIVYPFMQRYFVKGIMIGAVKG